jgi:hypothetical protein
LTIDQRIVRLRAFALSTLAEKRLGVDLSPGEAEALVDAKSINDALVLLERRKAQKRFTYPPLTNTPRIVRGDTFDAQNPDERTISPSPRTSPLEYPPPVRRAGESNSTSPTAIGILSITGVWSYLVAAIAARSTLVSGGDMPRAIISLLIAALGVAFGARSAAHLGEWTAVVASRHWWSLQSFIALLGLLVFITGHFAEQSVGFRLDSLLFPYSLLIWAGMTLSAFAVLRRKRTVPQ